MVRNIYEYIECLRRSGRLQQDIRRTWLKFDTPFSSIDSKATNFTSRRQAKSCSHGHHQIRFWFGAKEYMGERGTAFSTTMYFARRDIVNLSLYQGRKAYVMHSPISGIQIKRSKKHASDQAMRVLIVVREPERKKTSRTSPSILKRKTCAVDMKILSSLLSGRTEMSPRG